MWTKWTENRVESWEMMRAGSENLSLLEISLKVTTMVTGKTLRTPALSKPSGKELVFRF
jgi:hypothetical protein